MKATTPLLYLGYLFFRPFWWFQKLIPRNKKIWIFGAWMGTQYSDNARYLYEYVLKNCHNITPFWITRSNQLYISMKKEKLPVLKVWSFKGIFFSLFAKYVFITVGMSDVNPYFINGSKLIYLWHGMPLKKIGFKVFDSGHELSKVKQCLFDLFNPYWKFRCYKFLSTSSFFSKILKEAWDLEDDQLLEVGQPRCDVFFTKYEDDYIHKIKEKYPSSRILLYMPTYRSQEIPFNPFISEFGFNDDEFKNFLEINDIIFIYKPHFFDRNVNLHVTSKRFIYLKYDQVKDLYLLLNSVDSLITDYSSVYFDFLCTKKATYFFSFDLEIYKEKSREHYFDMNDYFHGIFCENWKEFYKKYNSEKDMHSEDDYLFFSVFCDGKSSEKLVNELNERKGIAQI